jgi:hypothetical protein
MPLILVKSGRKIGNAKAAIRSMEFRAKDIGIVDVILMRGKILLIRFDEKVPPMFVIKLTTKNETAIKFGPAHPGNVALIVNVGNIGAIANDTLLIFMSRHRRYFGLQS